MTKQKTINLDDEITITRKELAEIKQEVRSQALKDIQELILEHKDLYGDDLFWQVKQFIKSKQEQKK